ncbi:MAG: hypothetical protein VX632_06235 [Chloroflexota bacterium]|nr:hypothetical protein [Chloroflexota bacterium]
MLGQVGWDEQLHAVLFYLAVRGDVATGESGIDRYLSGVAASRCERKQVDGRLTAFALDMVNGFWCQVNLHRNLSGWSPSPAWLPLAYDALTAVKLQSLGVSS